MIIVPESPFGEVTIKYICMYLNRTATISYTWALLRDLCQASNCFKAGHQVNNHFM